MAHQIHQIGAVLAIMDGEVDAKADLFGVQPQQPCADAVERAGPSQRIGHQPRIVSEHLSADPLDPPRQFRRRPAGKGHQQDPTRIGAMDDQMRHAVGERVGLAGSGTRDDQQRAARLPVGKADPMLHRRALPVVQFFKIGCHPSSSMHVFLPPQAPVTRVRNKERT